MLRLLVAMMILCIIGYSESIIAMNEHGCSQFSFETFVKVAQYLDRTYRQQLDDYHDPLMMSAIVTDDDNISQEQIEVIRHGLHDYNDPEIRAIIVANDYQISQKKIDVIKNAVKSAIIYYDVHDNFVMVTRGDSKVVNVHSKVQHYTADKKKIKKHKIFGGQYFIACNINTMPTLSEDDFDDEDQDEDIFTL